jgi:large subunit ribosomal protein L23
LRKKHSDIQSAARRHKTEIKAAVQLMFKVDVKAIAVVNTKGSRTFRKIHGPSGQHPQTYVTLQWVKS